MYAVDCPACDSHKTNTRELHDHFLAVARADAGAEDIAARIQAAKEKRNAE